jgi:hypothetical protein
MLRLWTAAWSLTVNTVDLLSTTNRRHLILQNVWRQLFYIVIIHLYFNLLILIILHIKKLLNDINYICLIIYRQVIRYASCLHNTVATWRWLQSAAETCRSVKTKLWAVARNERVCSSVNSTTQLRMRNNVNTDKQNIKTLKYFHVLTLGFEFSPSWQKLFDRHFQFFFC